MATVEREQLTTDELRERLDQLTNELLGISVDEFLDRCRAQTLDMSSPAVSRLAVIGRLLISAESKK